MKPTPAYTRIPAVIIILALTFFLAPARLSVAATSTNTNTATWDTTSSGWTTVTGTPWDSVNGATNTAVFTNTSGSITVTASGIWVNNITYSPSGTFSIGGGTITLAGTSPTINVTSTTGALTISNSLAGSAGLTKSGAGTLILSGNNVYSGKTTVSSGVLTLSTSGSFSTNATVTVSTGGTLNITNAATSITTGLSNYILTVNGVANIANTVWINTNAGNNAILVSAGTLNIGSNSSVSLGTTATKTGFLEITSGGTLNIAQGGSLTTTKYNTAVGSSASTGLNLLSNAGTLTTIGLYVGNGGTGTNQIVNSSLWSNSGNNIEIGKSASSTGLNTVLNAGTLVNSANINVGNVAASSGINVFVNSGALTNTGSAYISVGNLGSAYNVYSNTAGTAVLNGGVLLGNGSSNNLNEVAFSGGTISGNIVMGRLGNFQTNRLAVSAGVTATNGSISIGTGYSATTSASNNLNRYIVNGGTVVSTKITLGADNSNVGNNTNRLELNGGTLTVDSIGTGSLTSSSGDSNSIIFNGGTLIASSTASASFISSPSLSVTIQGGGGTIDSSNKAVTVASIIDGPGTLTKAGTGTLTLTASNAYSGGTVLTTGTLAISNSSALGTGYLSNSASSTLLALSDSLALANNMVLGGGTLTIDVQNYTLSSFGQIAGPGSLTKLGTGTLLLSGNNNYSGGTLLSTGTLVAGSSSAFGSGTVTVAGNSTIQAPNVSLANAIVLSSGTLTMDSAAGNWTNAGVISSVGSVVKTGTGTLTLTTNNSYTGTTVVSNGTLALGVNSALSASGTLTVTNTSVFNLSGYSQSLAGLYGNGIVTNTVTGTLTLNVATGLNNIFGGTLAGSGGLALGGPGTVTLTTSNPITGVILVSSGTLVLTNSGSLSSASSIIATTGTTITVATTNPGIISTNMVLNGATLRLTGTNGSLSITGLSGDGTGQISSGSTYSGGNSVITDASGGILLSFAPSASFSQFAKTTGSYVTLTSAGSGTVNLGLNSTWGSTTASSNSLTFFSGGVWQIGNLGANTTSGADVGTNVVTNGASVYVGGGRFARDTWIIGPGTWTLGQTPSTSPNNQHIDQNVAGPATPLQFYVNTGGSMYISTKSAGLASGNSFGVANGSSGTNPTWNGIVVNGGTFRVSGGTYDNVTLGVAVTAGTNGTLVENNIMTISNSGSVYIAGNLTAAVASTNTPNAGSSLFQTNVITLTGPGSSLTVVGTLSASSNTGGSVNAFIWSGGTLSAGTIVASTNGWASSYASSSISNNTLYNTNGTLSVGNTAPGQAGATAVTGGYSQSASGTSAFEITGTNRASTWTGSSGQYSYLAITGQAFFGGSVALVMSNYDLATNPSALLTLSTFASSASSLTNATLTAETINGLRGSYTSGAFTNFSWLNTNGYGAYILSSTSTNLTFSYGTNRWSGSPGATWGASGSSAWTAGIMPDSSKAVALFGPGSGTSVTVDSNVTIGGLIFTNASGYTLSGNSTITALSSTPLGTKVVVQNQSGNHFINVPINLQSDMEITNASGSQTVTLGGAITGPGGIQVSSGTLGLNITASSTVSNSISGAGALSVGGGGTLTLTAANSYTGGTTVNGGVLKFQSSNPFGSGNISLTNGALLGFTGATTTSLSNNIAILKGNASVQNLGPSLLTLSGTLTKNGTTLYLGGGAGGINVTGQIVGSLANSDLYITNGTVTLSASNSYNGPTVVSGGATLVLGAENTLPSGSVLTLSNGILNASTYSASIAGLNMNSGSSLLVSANRGSQPQINSAGIISISADSVLDLAGMSSSLGIYQILAGSSLVGSFGTVTNLSSAYQLLYTSNSLSAQHLAQIGPITTSIQGPAAIITGGATNFNVSVVNSAPSQSASLQFTGAAGANVTGSIGSSTSSAGSSASVTGLSFNGTSVGAAQTGYFTISAPSAYGPKTSNATVTVDVYDHASAALPSTNVTLAPVHVGYTNAITSSAEISNAAGYRVALQTSATNSSNNISVSAVAGVSSSTSSNAIVTLGLGQSAGLFSSLVGISFGDDSSLSGALSTIGTNYMTVTGLVYSGQSIWKTSTSGNWTEFSNWDVYGGTPGLDGSLSTNDSAHFGAEGSGFVVLNTNAALNSLSFSNGQTSYTLNGTGTITLTQGASSPSIDNISGSHTISTALHLSTNANVNVASGATLTLGGIISGDGSISFNDAGHTIITGTGDSYTGTVTVSSGSSLQLGNGTGYSSLSSSAFVNNGTISINNLSSSKTIFGGGISGNGVFSVISGDVIFTGNNKNFSGTVNITTGSSLQLGNGGGDSTLGAGNIYNNGTLSFRQSVSVTQSGAISGSGLMSILGPGSLSLLADLSAYNGQIKVDTGSSLLLGNTGVTSASLSLSGGTISMGGNGSGNSRSSATFTTLTLTENSVIDFSNLSGVSSLSFGNFVMNGRTLSVYNWNGNTAWGTTSSSGGLGQFTHLFDMAGSTDLSKMDLSNISFYSGGAGSSFLGTGTFMGNEIVPVPEPSVVIAAVLLLAALILGPMRNLRVFVLRA